VAVDTREAWVQEWTAIGPSFADKLERVGPAAAQVAFWYGAGTSNSQERDESGAARIEGGRPLFSHDGKQRRILQSCPMSVPGAGGVGAGEVRASNAVKAIRAAERIVRIPVSMREVTLEEVAAYAELQEDRQAASDVLGVLGSVRGASRAMLSTIKPLLRDGNTCLMAHRNPADGSSQWVEQVAHVDEMPGQAEGAVHTYTNTRPGVRRGRRRLASALSARSARGAARVRAAVHPTWHLPGHGQHAAACRRCGQLGGAEQARDD